MQQLVVHTWSGFEGLKFNEGAKFFAIAKVGPIFDEIGMSADFGPILVVYV